MLRSPSACWPWACRRAVGKRHQADRSLLRLKPVGLPACLVEVPGMKFCSGFVLCFDLLCCADLVVLLPPSPTYSLHGTRRIDGRGLSEQFFGRRLVSATRFHGDWQCLDTSNLAERRTMQSSVFERFAITRLRSEAGWQMTQLIAPAHLFFRDANVAHPLRCVRSSFLQRCQRTQE